MERFGFIFLVAGGIFFAISFVIMGALPIVQYSDLKVVTLEQITRDIPYQFQELARDYPAEFEAAFGTKEATAAAFADALTTGREVYIGEACWHCHSQQIRRIDPNTGEEVGHDISRWAGDTGLESQAEEYFNDLNYPPMLGTRRVGPDLMREADRHTNDWHLAHLWNPVETSPYSVMPRYTWFFDDEKGLKPNKRALSIVAYMQWLGSWHTQFAPSKTADLPQIEFDETWYPPEPAHAAPEEEGPAEEDPY